MELIRVSWIFSTHNACLNVHRGETNQQSASEAPTYRSPTYRSSDLPEPRPTGAGLISRYLLFCLASFSLHHFQLSKTVKVRLSLRTISSCQRSDSPGNRDPVDG